MIDAGVPAVPGLFAGPLMSSNIWDARFGNRSSVFSVIVVRSADILEAKDAAVQELAKDKKMLESNYHEA